MSNRTLRAMYTRLAATHTPGERRPDDSACWVAPLEGLVSRDTVFGSHPDEILARLRPRTHSPIANPVHRLYAAIGAAMTSTGKPAQPVVVAFFERKEIAARGWLEALPLTAPLPLLLVVLPRSKGGADSLDLGKLARAAGLPAIPVDAHDPIALYRVAHESLVRARAAGGAALLEAIHLDDAPPAIEKLAAYLLQRSIASQSWIDRTRSNFPNSPAKRNRS